MVVAISSDTLPVVPVATPDLPTPRESASPEAFQDVLQRAQRPPQGAKDNQTAASTPSTPAGSPPTAPSTEPSAQATPEPNIDPGSSCQQVNPIDEASEASDATTDPIEVVAVPPQSALINLQALLTAVANVDKVNGREMPAIAGQPASNAQATDAAQLLSPVSTTGPLKLQEELIVVSAIVLPQEATSAAVTNVASAPATQQVLASSLGNHVAASPFSDSLNAVAKSSNPAAQGAGPTTSGAPTLLSDAPQPLTGDGVSKQADDMGPSLDPTAASASVPVASIPLDTTLRATTTTNNTTSDAATVVAPSKSPDTNPTPSTDSSGANSTATASQASVASPSRFAMHASPRTLIEGSATTPGVSEADRNRLIQRVSRAFQSVGPDGGTMRLRLSPPELGSIRVEIQIQGGQMSAKVEAETSMARSLLLDNLPALRDRLEQQDIKLTRFDVDLFGGSTGNLPQQSQRDPSADQQGQRIFARRDGASDTAAAPATVTTAARNIVGGNGQLNIVI